MKSALGPIDIPYLHSDAVGGVLAEGLTELYTVKPERPIEYLAKWLLQYCKTQSEARLFQQTINRKKTIEQEFVQKQFQLKLQKEQDDKEAVLKAQQVQEYLDYFANYPYQEELLVREIPDYLKTKHNLAAVYICRFTHQKSDVDTDLVDDPAAFIDAKSTQLLKYIDFLMNIYLSEKAVLTYEVLKPMQPLEDGTIPINYGKYIPDLTKEPRIFFHRFPALGCYYAVPMHYETHLFEDAFDTGLQNRLKYLNELNQQKQEIAAQREAMERNIEAHENEREQHEQEFQAYLDSVQEPTQPEFLSKRHELVLCVDTMGQDRELSVEERKALYDFSQFFSESISKKESELLSKDIDSQIEYLQSLPEHFYETIQEEENQFVEPMIAQLEELKAHNENEYNYEVDCFRFAYQKQILLKESFEKALFFLVQRRVLKYPQVILAALLLLGYSKDEITIENQLNWKKVAGMINSDFMLKLSQVNHRGAKPAPLPYATVARIEKQLEKIDEERLFQYNWALSVLYQLLLKYCKLRRLDVEIRNIKYNEKKDRIAAQTEQVRLLTEKRSQELADSRANFQPDEENEEFNEERWLDDWNRENPMPAIEDEPVDEYDEDIE